MRGASMATEGQIDQLAAQVLARLDQIQTVDAMAEDFVRLGIDDAYRVQLALVAQRCARGERIVGRKVAFTSRGTMTQFGVTESAFGTILSGGVFTDGDVRPCFPISSRRSRGRSRLRSRRGDSKVRGSPSRRCSRLPKVSSRPWRSSISVSPIRHGTRLRSSPPMPCIGGIVLGGQIDTP